MTAKTSSESKILCAYAEKTPGSARLYERACGIFPNGVTHVGRYLRPHPIYVSRAQGSRKWDVDGNEYVDYIGGHGALMLGHGHPAVVEAVARQAADGVHFGACHELEVAWASLIREMVPCAERVRFTNSGTEATLLALRLARAYTGKSNIVRFAGHFHGWQDHLASLAGEQPVGVLPEIMDHVIVCPSGDLERTEEILRSRFDIAAVILEPTGATFGHVPLRREFVADLRRLTSELGILLIFDEVVTGFRCSTGGAQLHYGITPDLASLAKIVAGGYPAGAVVGRAELFGALEFKESAGGFEPPALPHQGTNNGNAISATAGIVTLKTLRGGPATEEANRAAAQIRAGFNDAIRRKGIGWIAYGEFSDFHIFTNPRKRSATLEDIRSGSVPAAELKNGTPPRLQHLVRIGMLLGGVDIVSWPGGLVSAVHSAQDVDRTVSAFTSTLDILGEAGELS